MHLRRANARVLDGWLYRNEGWGVLRDRRVFRIFLSSSHALTLNRRTALHSYGVLDASSLAWMSMTRSCAWPGGVGDCLEPPGSHLGRLSKIYSDSTGASGPPTPLLKEILLTALLGAERRMSSNGFLLPSQQRS